MKQGAQVTADDVIAQPKSLKEQLVGTWLHVEVNIKRPDGKTFDPWGPNGKGIFIFGPDGYFTHLRMTADRPKYASNDRTKGTPEENSAKATKTLSFYGKYAVDEVSKTLIMHIEVSSFPNWEGTDQKRPFTIVGDELRYENPATALGGAPAVNIMKRAK